MKIDFDFNVGDTTYHLDGDCIASATISRITLDVCHSDSSFTLVYYLSDGFMIPRNEYPNWSCKRLFHSKEELINYLQEQ